MPRKRSTTNRHLFPPIFIASKNTTLNAVKSNSTDEKKEAYEVYNCPIFIGKHTMGNGTKARSN